MRVSGFTIVRNAQRYGYPIREAIKSILPICDEFVVGVGKSDDDTLQMIKSIGDKKIRIFETQWDLKMGPEVLSHETNLALRQCNGDWAFYVQGDEVVHEADLPKLKKIMEENFARPSVDALRFKYLHFYGSYYRYRIDKGWYQKQDRIIRNNGNIESYGDAFAFRRKDGKPLNTVKTGCFIYHYGWVHSGKTMTERRVNHKSMGFTGLENLEAERSHDYGDLNRFPAYFGSHPAVMEERIKNHELSNQDKIEISRRYWWHVGKILKLRYKTSRRVKESLGR